MKVRDMSTLFVESLKDLDSVEAPAVKAPPIEALPTVIEADSSKEPQKAGSKY